MIEKLMRNARQALKTARIDLAAEDANAAVNRSYYAAYYAAWAMLAAAGVEKPKTHNGMIAEFSRRFVKDGPFTSELGAILSKLENLRCYADYTLSDIPPDTASEAIESAERFVDAVANYHLASSRL